MDFRRVGPVLQTRRQLGAEPDAGDEALVEVPALRHREVGQSLGPGERDGAVEDVAAMAVPPEEVLECSLVALPGRLRDGLPAIFHCKVHGGYLCKCTNPNRNVAILDDALVWLYWREKLIQERHLFGGQVIDRKSGV